MFRDQVGRHVPFGVPEDRLREAPREYDSGGPLMRTVYAGLNDGGLTERREVEGLALCCQSVHQKAAHMESRQLRRRPGKGT